MNEELMVEMMKMSNFYSEAHTELLITLKISVDSLSENELNKLRILSHSLFSLKNFLNHKGTAIHQPEKIEETMKKLSLEISDLESLLDEPSKKSLIGIDELLGNLDKISEIHGLQMEQFETIQEMIEPEPLH